MKTIQDLKTEIGKLSKEYSDFNGDPLTKARLKKKIDSTVNFIRKCILYLETSPREEFIEKEKKRINKLINSIKSACKATKDNDWKKKHKAENGYSKLVKQAKTLNFILQ